LILIHKGLAGRPNSRWENDIKEELRIMKIHNWTNASRTKLNGRK
jgi:hypothetical protein